MEERKFPGHEENIPALNRISGQVDGIKKMISDGRYCLDIINQISAVRAALKRVQKNILKKHLQHCVAESFSLPPEERQKKIDELTDLFGKSDN